MRRRRDPFARVTYVPVRQIEERCSWCGAVDPRSRTALATNRPLRRVYGIAVESDSGRTDRATGHFCAWDCAESYHDAPFGGR